jgi:hypothetical protein
LYNDIKTAGGGWEEEDGKTGRKTRHKSEEPPHQQNLTEEKKRKQKFFSSIFLCVSVFYCFPPFSFLLVFRLFFSPSNFHIDFWGRDHKYISDFGGPALHHWLSPKNVSLHLYHHTNNNNNIYL